MYADEIDSRNLTGSEAKQWDDYMERKKAKLMHQINDVDIVPQLSTIFNGVSIFVNGYTDPPAAELRRLIKMHGGEYHAYYKHGHTTYTIATHVANGKAKKLRKDEKIIHPKWIIDSIETGARQPEADYLLYKDNCMSEAAKKFFAPRTRQELNAATDPNFVDNFYKRSRLHLISTLAQEMKQYIAQLRENPSNMYPSRKFLTHLIDENFESVPKETVCHIDLDCFFVSVARRTRPDLIGKPVAITHSKGTENSAGMSEVASCSYEARSLGIYNGCLMRKAKELCPDLICLPYQFDDYRKVSKQIYTIVSRYTLYIRPVSCDEMYVDLRDLCDQLKISNVMGIIAVIRSEMIAETGCNASVGISSNMLMARIATKRAKPNGQFVISSEEIEEFIKKERITSLPGVGHAISSAIKNVFGELNSCAELQSLSSMQLKNLLGEKTGMQLYNMCRGIDKERNFLENVTRKSVSCDINYGIRFEHENEAMDFLGKMAVELEKKLEVAHLSVSAITLKILVRAPDAPFEPEKFLGCGRCNAITRTTRMLNKTTSASILHEEAKKLMKSINPNILDLRGIGIQLTHLSDESGRKKQKNCRINTLTQFFAVRKKMGSQKDEKSYPALPLERYPKKLVVSNRTMKRIPKKAIRLDYKNFVNSDQVKAEMLRTIQTTDDPLSDDTKELIKYFRKITQYGDLPLVVSQIRFLERVAAEKSLDWVLAVAAIKNAIDCLSTTVYGHNLF